MGENEGFMDVPLSWRVARLSVWGDVREWAGSHPRCARESKRLHFLSAKVSKVAGIGPKDRTSNVEGAKGGCVGPEAPLESRDGEVKGKVHVGVMCMS
jgi:hypothetical protein